MFMSPSDIIMEIVDTNYLHLNLSIFEKDILHVKSGHLLISLYQKLVKIFLHLKYNWLENQLKIKTEPF